MKRTKICTKCGSTRLLRVKDTGGNAGVSLILSLFSTAPVTRYACTDCGYVESWVEEKHLDKLKDRYEFENRS